MKNTNPHALYAYGLLASLLGLVVGIGWQLQQSWLWTSFSYAALLLGSIFSGVMLIKIKTLIITKPVAIGIIAMVVGFSWAGLQAIYHQDHKLEANLENRHITVEGQVIGLPQITPQKTRFLLSVKSAHIEEKKVLLPKKILVT